MVVMAVVAFVVVEEAEAEEIIGQSPIATATTATVATMVEVTSSSTHNRGSRTTSTNTSQTSEDSGQHPMIASSTSKTIMQARNGSNVNLMTPLMRWRLPWIG